MKNSWSTLLPVSHLQNQNKLIRFQATHTPNTKKSCHCPDPTRESINFFTVEEDRAPAAKRAAGGTGWNWAHRAYVQRIKMRWDWTSVRLDSAKWLTKLRKIWVKLGCIQFNFPWCYTISWRCIYIYIFTSIYSYLHLFICKCIYTYKSVIKWHNSLPTWIYNIPCIIISVVCQDAFHLEQII